MSRVMSAEARAKLSASHKGKKRAPWIGAKISAYQAPRSGPDNRRDVWML